MNIEDNHLSRVCIEPSFGQVDLLMRTMIFDLSLQLEGTLKRCNLDAPGSNITRWLQVRH